MGEWLPATLSSLFRGAAEARWLTCGVVTSVDPIEVEVDGAAVAVAGPLTGMYDDPAVNDVVVLAVLRGSPSVQYVLLGTTGVITEGGEEPPPPLPAETVCTSTELPMLVTDVEDFAFEATGDGRVHSVSLDLKLTGGTSGLFITYLFALETAPGMFIVFDATATAPYDGIVTLDPVWTVEFNGHPLAQGWSVRLYAGDNDEVTVERACLIFELQEPPPEGLTFTATDTPLAIPDAIETDVTPGEVQSQVTVSIGTPNEDPVSAYVHVAATHAYASDLEIVVSAGSWSQTLLAYNQANTSNLFFGTTVSVPAADVNGTWTLTARDWFEADAGTLDGWYVTFPDY